MGSRMWTKLVMTAGAAIVAVTAGTAVMAAIDDRGDAPSRQTLDAPAGTCLEDAAECADNPGSDVASICLQGAEDCDDTIDSGSAAGGTCLVGTVDCNDTPDGDLGAAGGTCLEGAIDCNDTPDGDGGS